MNNFALVKYEFSGDERGDLRTVVAVSTSKDKLEDHCLKTYNKPAGNPLKFSYDDYYLIEQTDIQIA